VPITKGKYDFGKMGNRFLFIGHTASQHTNNRHSFELPNNFLSYLFDRHFLVIEFL